MKKIEIIKNYYVGFLTNDNDPLPLYSCYYENQKNIKFAAAPKQEEVARIFNEKSINENWVHFFEVKETQFDFSEFGYRSAKESKYLISYSK